MQTLLRRGENPPTMLSDCKSSESLENLQNDFFIFLSQEFGAGVLGRTRQLHASSCDEILENNPRNMSGLYWIRNGTAIVQQYCAF